MGIAGQVGFEVAGNLARSGLLVHSAIQGTFDGIRVARERAVDSVQELALRLQEARRDQRAAERRAASAEDRLALMERALARASAEAAALREALSVEREFSAGLREIIGA